MAHVLTRPQGSSGIPGIVIQGINVPGSGSAPANIVTLDSVIAAGNMSIKWIYTIMDATNSKVLSGEILALHRYETLPIHNRYGIIGDQIPHTIDIKLSGPNLILEIENNQVDAFVVNIARIQLLA